jgi:hypothetical protein
MTFVYFYFFVAQFAAPNDGMASAPHIPPRSCALPNIPPTTNANFGWLLCCRTKRWPPKAEVTSFSLIFDVLHFGAPNEEPNSNESAPNIARLVWAHRDQRRQDLGPWQMLPWQKMAKPLGGRARRYLMLVVVCFVLLCFVLDRTFGSFWLTNM